MLKRFLWMPILHDIESQESWYIYLLAFGRIGSRVAYSMPTVIRMAVTTYTYGVLRQRPRQLSTITDISRENSD